MNLTVMKVAGSVSIIAGLVWLKIGVLVSLVWLPGAMILGGLAAAGYAQHQEKKQSQQEAARLEEALRREFRGNNPAGPPSP